MRFPLLSILLIATIIACPLWCAAGVGNCCQVDQQFSGKVGKSKQCCHCDDAAERHHSVPSDHEHENQVQCRGICSGAVVDDGQPVIEDIGLSQPLAIFDAATIALSASWHDRIGRPIEFSGGNQGRSLRTLHASFLC